MATGDRTGAYQLAYDSLRKAPTALLAAQGLRATSRGGHLAVERAMVAQFGDAVPVFRGFGRLRRNRNRFEYPGDSASEPQEDDVADAIAVASEAVDEVSRLLVEDVLVPWA